MVPVRPLQRATHFGPALIVDLFDAHTLSGRPYIQRVRAFIYSSQLFADSFLYIGLGFGVGVVLSVILFKRLPTFTPALVFCFTDDLFIAGRT